MPSKWVTRERPKIDRIACPWLIRRFVAEDAEFMYVPTDQVFSVAQETGATPYDIAGAEFGHTGDDVGERCSFDAIVRIYDIRDPALDRLATIVRGSDTSRPDLAPQCPGLSAFSYGLSANFSDDYEQLAHGMVMYDALYTWCRGREAEAAAPAAETPQPKGDGLLPEDLDLLPISHSNLNSPPAPPPAESNPSL